MAKLFVSYSRKDSITAKKIIQALKDLKHDIWVDWEDIPPATDWLEQILRGIEGVDAFIFLVSPDSAKSEVCKVEVNHAANNNKRIIPVEIREVPPKETIETIRKLNWTPMKEESQFREGIVKVNQAIVTDFKWVEEHNRLQLLALEWERKKESSLLLRGRNLREARKTISASAKKDPKPTDLHKVFIKHSTDNERRRGLVIGATIVSAIIMAGLAFFAFQQRNIALKYADEAKENEQLAISKKNEAERNLILAEKNAKEAREAQQRAEKERREAERQKDIAAAQRSAALAQIYQVRSGELYTSTLLAIDSWQIRPSDEAEEILRRNISLLPVPVGKAGQGGKINSVAFNAGGEIFVTAAEDGSVCAWQIEDGKKIFCLGNSGSVIDAVVSPTEPVIITGDNQGIAKIISLNSQATEAEFDLGSPITDVEIQKSGRYAAITSEDGKIALIDMRARKKSGFDLEASGIRFTAFSPDGTQLATGSADGVVSIWTLTALNHVIVKPKHKGEIIAIEFSPNGRFLVTGGTDGFAVMLDSKTGVELYRARHNDHVKDIAFNPDGSRFVTVSNDRTIRVWDASTGTQLLNMSQTNFVQVVKMSKDGQWIATTGDDRTVRVWSAVTGAELFQIPIQGKGTTLDFSDDGKYLTAGDDNGNIYIWDISAIPTPVESAEFYGVTTSALYSPSGNLIAASDDRRIWIINPKAIPNPTTDSQKPFSELKSNITKVIFSATDKWISLLTAGNEAVVYNIQNRGGRTIRSDYPVQAIAFTLDEKSIITGDLAGNLQVWDAFNGRLIQTPLNLGGRITSLAQASNLLAIGTEGKIHIVDINSFEEQWRLESDGANQLLAFSPDGTFLVSNNTQSQIHIWKQENGEFVFQHEMVLEGITSLAFQPGNGFLAIGATGNVYLINPSTFKEFARIPHTGTVNSVSFSLDGNILLTSSLKTLQLWDVGRIQELKQEDLVTTACGRLFENFTSEEWSTFFGDEPSRKPCPNLPTP